MKNYKYIIVGGGMAGSSAVMGIRKNDLSGSIALFSSESSPPYNRPPLSKGLWNKMKVADIIRPLEKYQVDIYTETPIISINGENNIVISDKERENGYTKLLIATGGSPVRLPNMPKDVISYRTLDDYSRLKSLAEEKDTFCVIGGGFIGSEIAASLNKIGKDVTLIFPEPGISNQIFPDDLSLFLNDYYESKGVTVRPNYWVEAITKDGDDFIVRIRDAKTNKTDTLVFDAVVLGIGINPNVRLAADAGLAIENGILVNEFLQTSNPDIYAAGDVANFYNVGLKKRTRAEHEDNANQMGVTAGLNMSGSKVSYSHFPFFYSDLFDLGYEAVGEFNKSHQIIADWIESYKKGTLFYLDDNQHIRGLVFWNLWGKIDRGRELIVSEKRFSIADLKRSVYVK